MAKDFHSLIQQLDILHAMILHTLDINIFDRLIHNRISFCCSTLLFWLSLLFACYAVSWCCLSCCCSSSSLTTAFGAPNTRISISLASAMFTSLHIKTDQNRCVCPVIKYFPPDFFYMSSLFRFLFQFYFGYISGNYLNTALLLGCREESVFKANL